MAAVDSDAEPTHVHSPLVSGRVPLPKGSGQAVAVMLKPLDEFVQVRAVGLGSTIATAGLIFTESVTFVEDRSHLTTGTAPRSWDTAERVTWLSEEACRKRGRDRVSFRTG